MPFPLGALRVVMVWTSRIVGLVCRRSERFPRFPTSQKQRIARWGSDVGHAWQSIHARIQYAEISSDPETCAGGPPTRKILMLDGFAKSLRAWTSTKHSLKGITICSLRWSLLWAHHGLCHQCSLSSQAFFPLPLSPSVSIFPLSVFARQR
jgi:hypothetical protein